MVDWFLKGQDPKWSYWHVWVDGYPEPIEEFEKACYANLWDYFSWDGPADRFIVYHPFKPDVEENIKVVDCLINLSCFEDVFFTKGAKEGLENGFEINPEVSLGLIKAALISLRAIFEYDGFVSTWKKFVEYGVPPEIAVLYPFKFRVEGDLFNFQHNDHWHGFTPEVNVPSVFNGEVKDSNTAWGCFNNVENIIDLRKEGFEYKEKLSFFNIPHDGYVMNKENVSKLQELVMKGAI